MYLNQTRFSPIAILALLIAKTAAAGGLAWTTQRIEQTVTLDQEKAEASYHFKNEAAISISIIDVRTSWGCTTANLEKRDYAPGEEGELQAILNLARSS